MNEFEESSELEKLKERKNLFIMYLEEKVLEEDWHGVSDVANDLRELEVEIRILKNHG